MPFCTVSRRLCPCVLWGLWIIHNLFIYTEVYCVTVNDALRHIFLMLEFFYSLFLNPFFSPFKKLFQRQSQYFLHNFLWNLLNHGVWNNRKAPALAFEISHKGTFMQVVRIAFRKLGGFNTGQNQWGKRKVLLKCYAASLPLNYPCKKGLCRDPRWSDSMSSATQDLKH